MSPGPSCALAYASGLRPGRALVLTSRRSGSGLAEYQPSLVVLTRDCMRHQGVTMTHHSILSSLPPGTQHGLLIVITKIVS